MSKLVKSEETCIEGTNCCDAGQERTTVQRLSPAQDYHAELSRAVKIGMTQHPRSFPTKYMYDEIGSELAEQVTGLPQYNVYRAEVEILKKYAQNIVQLVVPDELVELGSGTSTKTRLIIEAMHTTGCCRYAPLEISETALRQAANTLTTDYNWLQVHGQLGDFDTDLPKLKRNGRRLMTFLGNTVGNFKTKSERGEFLAKLAATIIPGDALVLGIDLMKDVKDIFAAYSDTTGLRRKLALHTLEIMNHELKANFRENDFEPELIWNDDFKALERMLLAKQDTKVSICELELDVEFAKGEGIHLWSSTKFTREGISQELADVGLKVGAWYTDSANQSAVLIALPDTE